MRRDGDAWRRRRRCCWVCCSARRCWRLLLDREPGDRARAASPLCSMAAAVEPLRTLWTAGHSIATATRTAERSADGGDGMERRGRRLAAGRGDPDRGSRGAGGAEIARAARLRAERAKLVEAWGLEIAPGRSVIRQSPRLTPARRRDLPTAIAAGARRSAPSSPSAASRRRGPRSAAPARARCRTAATAPRAWSGCPSAGARSGCAARARSAS